MLNTLLVVKPIWNVSLNAQKPIEDYPDEKDISLGAALKRERLNRGWSQETTAKYLKLLTPNYSRLERNIHTPHIKKFYAINDFLGFNFWDDKTNTLSNKLYLYRIKNKLSAKECGELVGVSRNTIKRIENKVKTSYQMSSMVAHFLGKSN